MRPGRRVTAALLAALSVAGIFGVVGLVVLLGQGSRPEVSAWAAATGVLFLVVPFALYQKIDARRSVYRYNGRAKELNADRNVRREAIRLLTALAMAGALVPFAGGVRVWFLVGVAVCLALNSLLDLVADRQIESALDEEIANEAKRVAGLADVAQKADAVAVQVSEIRDALTPAIDEVHQIHEAVVDGGEKP